MAQKKITQTAGRTQLGEFAPEFARLNDDILFGEVWSRNDLLSLRDRSLVTLTSLISQGITDTFVNAHDLAEVEAAIQPNTKAVYLETLGNPNSDIPGNTEKYLFVSCRNAAPISWANSCNLSPVPGNPSIGLRNRCKCNHSFVTSPRPYMPHNSML